MLVIISDLHLTDGTSGQTIKEGAFSVFRQRLRDLAYDASKRSDGTYKPIKELHILLLGDILDVIRSTKWLDGTVRPWDLQMEDGSPQNRDAELADKVTEINTAILEHNKPSLSILKNLVSGEKSDQITIPPATENGGVADVGWEPDDEKRVTVDVKIHYMVGNHDWFYHLPGKKYNSIRREVVNDIGLVNDPEVPFPHEPDESDAIAKVLETHRVLARHGDIYDPFNYMREEGRDASSLGDAIVIELLNKFPQRIEEEESIPEDVKLGMRELDNVRPTVLVPLWIDGLLRRSGADKRQQKLVKRVWDKLADEFLTLDFVKQQDTWSPFDDVDKLQALLKFSQGISVSRATRMIRWFNEKFAGPSRDTYYKNALDEVNFRNQKAHYVVYGHTHHHDAVALDLVQPSGKPEIKQIYFNTGTWRRVHELAQRETRDAEFLEWNVMTYAAFFADGERKGRPFETWSGALSVSSNW